MYERKIAIINEETKEVKLYDSIVPVMNDIKRDIVYSDGKWGLIDSKGYELCKLIYDSISPQQYDGFLTVRINDKYGIIDLKGNEIGSIKYDRAFNFINGFAIVGLGCKEGFIDKKGKEICKIEYEAVQNFTEDGKAVVKKDGKWGIIDKKGKTLCDFKYNEITDFKNDLWRVKNQGNFYSILNEEFEEIIPFKYRSIGKQTDNSYLMQVSDGFHSGFINRKGEEIIPMIYDYFLDYGKDKPIIARKGQNWGIISRDGKILVEFKYDHILYFDDDGYAKLIDRRYTRNMKNTYEHIEWADVNGNIYPIKPSINKN